jgi:hypothetical protein
MSVGSVMVSTVSNQEIGSGPNPTPALHSITICPIPFIVAKKLIERHHYLHSLPGGTMLCFGTFEGERLLGALTLGAGPYLAYHLVEGADRDDCMVLTRLWLSNALPINSESRLISIVSRLLKHNTSVKFLVSYADPAAGHVGTIYQAAGWLYTGLSSAMSLYDMGDGIAHHSRSLAHNIGSHSIQYLKSHGIEIKLVAQSPKHRYIKFLNENWRPRLTTPVLPYPKKEI